MRFNATRAVSKRTRVVETMVVRVQETVLDDEGTKYSARIAITPHLIIQKQTSKSTHGVSLASTSILPRISYDFIEMLATFRLAFTKSML